MEKSGLNAVIRHVRRVVLVSSSDEELLGALACRRDEDAFEVLCKRHGPMVWAVCRRVLRHTQDAEDAFQATFLVLIRKSASIRKRGSIASWLYGVAYRTARKALAVNARRRQFENLAACRPRSVVEEDHWDLDREVNALPEKYRLPVVLCELQGRTRKEVAELLKIPEGTLSSRLATARKTLARRLGDRGVLLAIGAAAPAKVPAPLMISTIQTGLSLVAGGEAAGVISGNAILLSQGVLRAMLLMKLKSVATAVVVLGSLAVSVGQYASFPSAQGSAAIGDERQVSGNKSQQGDEKHSRSDDAVQKRQAADQDMGQVKLDLLKNSLKRKDQSLARMKEKETEILNKEIEFHSIKQEWDYLSKVIEEMNRKVPSVRNELKQAEADLQEQLKSKEAAFSRFINESHEARWKKHGVSKLNPIGDLAGRFQYRIPVQFYDRMERKGARIEIHEVWGTSPKIQVGGQYVVHGKYEIPNHAKGKLYFYVTSEGDWSNSGPTLELQTMAVEKGSGEFTLMHSLGGPGQFHVQLLADDGHQETLANVYFK